MLANIIHPGFYLQDILENINMTQKEASMRLGIAENHLSEMLNGKRTITPDTALKLETVFGGNASYWNNLQTKYNEVVARREQEENLKLQIPLLEKFKSFYRDLVDAWACRYTRKAEEKVESLLTFFGVTSLAQIAPVSQVAFRKSNKHFISDESVAAWLKLGERAADTLEVKPYDREKLRNELKTIRTNTLDVSTFGSKLIEIWKECGVKIVFVKHITHAPVSGATRWIQDTPIIQLSDRGKHFDTVVFTLFHELGHVLLHEGETFLDAKVAEDGKAEYEVMKKEQEADNFAEESLMLSQVSEIITSDTDIKQLAKKLQIHHSLIAGKMARLTGNYAKMDHLRTKVQISGK